MPGFDGSGPRGEGPMTGCGEGYCVMVLSGPPPARAPRGKAGACLRPVDLARPAISPARCAYRPVRERPIRWPWFSHRLGPGRPWNRWYG